MPTRLDAGKAAAIKHMRAKYDPNTPLTINRIAEVVPGSRAEEQAGN